MSQEPLHPFVERVTLAGNQVVTYVKQALAAGNVHRVVVYKSDGTPLMDIPLGTGVAVSGLATLLAPTLVALGALAALLSQVRVEITRDPRV